MHDNLQKTICNIEFDKSMLISIFSALHLLHEDLKLSVSLHSMRMTLNIFLHQFAMVLNINIPSYIQYYCQEVGVIDQDKKLLNVKEECQDINCPSLPSIYEWLLHLMKQYNIGNSINESICFSISSE